MKIVGLIIIFVAIVFFDVPSILKRTDKKKEFLWIYFTLIAIGFIMSLLQVINKIPPSPNKLIKDLIQSFM